MLPNLPPEFRSAFTPFMLGSISLIAFLSIRNAHLAGRTRDLCQKLSESQKTIWQASLSLQLLYFVKRYKLNNWALVFAILSVLFFGAMIGIASFIPTAGTTGVLTGVLVSMFILGGILATSATAISIYETYIGRRSLFTHVACTIVEKEFEEPGDTLCKNIKKIRRTIQKSLKEKDTDNLKKNLDDIIEGMEGKPHNSPSPPPQ